MPRLTMIVTAALIGSVPALARPATTTEATAVTAAIKRFITAETEAAYAATCEPDTAITDHVPPYVFAGPGACEAHWRAVLAWTANNHITVKDYGALQQLLFTDVDGDRSYAVYSAAATLTHNGVQQVERANWTFVLREHAGKWHIQSMTWSTLGFDPAGEATPSAPQSLRPAGAKSAHQG